MLNLNKGHSKRSLICIIAFGGMLSVKECSKTPILHVNHETEVPKWRTIQTVPRRLCNRTVRDKDWTVKEISMMWLASALQEHRARKSPDFHRLIQYYFDLV